MQLLTRRQLSGRARVVHERLRWGTWTWAFLALLAFVGFAFTLGPPETPEGRGAERDLQFALLGGVALALVVGWRWEALGGALLVAAGIAIGVVAVVAFHPLEALAIAAIFALPGIAFLALSSVHHGVVVRAAAAVFVVGALAVGGVGATQLHAHYFGPAHPVSRLRALPPSPVTWVWSGALAPRAIAIRALVDPPDARARLAVADNAEFADPRWLDPSTAPGSNAGVAAFSVDALTPRTTYHYAVEVDGALDRSRAGHFTTPADGPFSFTVALGACAITGSNGAVYDAIRVMDPLLYLVLGDFHYGNVEADDPARFRRALDETLSAPAQALLYRSVPIAYTWDDHDFGGNNSDSSSPGREAAQRVYREYVPHYPFAGEGGPIFQAFTIGRMRFLITDTRSARTSETMLGEPQRRWLESELLAAHERGEIAVWVNTVPWIVEASPGADHWGGHAAERAELADFIAERGLDRVLMLAADAHMIAIDDGTHTDYSSSREDGFPLFQVGALDRPGSEKGGPYSEGAYPGAGQYGRMDVIDDGGPQVRLIWTGLNWERTEIVRHEMTFTIDGSE